MNKARFTPRTPAPESCSVNKKPKAPPQESLALRGLFLRRRASGWGTAFLMTLSGCRGGPDVGAIIGEFENGAGVDFEKCGVGGVIDCSKSLDNYINPDPEFRQHSACFLEAWNECRPATTVLDWYNLTADTDDPNRIMYIVPDGSQCRLVIFESDPEVSRVECTDLIPVGACGVLEPRECMTVESF